MSRCSSIMSVIKTVTKQIGMVLSLEYIDWNSKIDFVQKRIKDQVWRILDRNLTGTELLNYSNLLWNGL